MKIANSSIVMSSQHSLQKSYSQKKSLSVWQDTRDTALDDSISKPLKDSIKLSQEALDAMKNASACKGIEPKKKVRLSDKEQQKIMILEKMLSALTGKKIKIQIPDVEIDSSSIEAMPKQTPETNKTSWGFEYDFQESYQETENTSFTASGLIQTADGKEITFEVTLNMSRSFIMKNQINIKGGEPKLTDPLVINYDGNPADLVEGNFSFDLDADGVENVIPLLRPGSGFLALDLNEDAIINNGTELFGPTIGNGFEELAKYDTDNNNWIDENDAIFDKLRIWTKDNDGNDQLFALGQKGIGAIYLGNVAAPFQYRNNSNQLLGQNQTAGIFLREDGSVSTIQQIDLTIK